MELVTLNQTQNDNAFEIIDDAKIENSSKLKTVLIG